MRSPEGCKTLEDVRAAIDALDREIIRLIGRRAGYVDRAARFKTDASSVRATERQRAMLADRRRWAKAEGLSPDAVEDLYRGLIDYFVQREMETLDPSPDTR